MRADKLSDAIGMIDEGIVEAADKSRKQKKNKRIWLRWVAAAACLCIAVTAIWGRDLLGSDSKTNRIVSAHAIEQAVYPEMAPYPNEKEFINKVTGEWDDEAFDKVHDAWLADKEKQLDQPEGYQDGLMEFYYSSMGTFFEDTGTENRVYSPINVYMALAMLAELTDGESRKQILDVLGTGDMVSLRQQARSVWNANYCNNGSTTSVLANSVWLRDDIGYNKETMKTLAEDYYTSSFSGEMGSEKLNEALRGWINDQTGDLLKEQADGLEMSSETVLALVSTIYYQAKWGEEFLERNNQEGIFHGAAGDEECEFLYQSSTAAYYWGEKFGAVSKRLRESGRMWLFLPDEGVSPEELLADEEVLRLSTMYYPELYDYENTKTLVVNLYLPKFDIVSDVDLKDSMKALGITDVFDETVADFTPTTADVEAICLSEARHAARVAIDEEGVTAAAYTYMAEAGAAMPPDDEIDFRLDRPFVFVISGTDNSPLFVGIVNSVN